MPRILIQPCANTEARRNWRKTMSTRVPFAEEPYRAALSRTQLRALTDLHGAFEVSFWGTLDYHDKIMSKITTGDIALFTWQGSIRAIGEIGHNFRNREFADVLWREKDDTKSFPNVYSLLSFAETDFPYLLMPAGTRPKNGSGFRQGRLVEDVDEVTRIIDAFDIRTHTEDQAEEVEEGAVAESLEKGVELAIEKFRRKHARKPHPPRSITVGNSESMLVHEFVRWDVAHTYQRFTCSVGTTDLHAAEGQGVDLIEAKGGSSTKRIREAVAQLLHYAPYSPKRVTRMTALLPEKPGPADLAYLRRLGIDCVYRTEPQQFVRVEASAQRREHMERVWNDSTGGTEAG